jgi:hypothetical protein
MSYILDFITLTIKSDLYKSRTPVHLCLLRGYKSVEEGCFLKVLETVKFNKHELLK